MPTYLCCIVNLIIMNKIFEDTSTAFALKSDSELERAYFLFKLIANEPLVRIGTAVTNFAINAHLPVEALLGQRYSTISVVEPTRRIVCP